VTRAGSYGGGMMTTMKPVSILFAALLVLGACSSGDDSESVVGGDRPSSAGEHMDDGGHMDDDPGHMRDGEDENSAVAEGAREVEVSARSFAYDPDALSAEVGEDIAVVLTSTDILHDFVIDELDAHVAADGGETASGGFTAQKAGTYTFYCSVPGHRAAGMEGTLTVS